MKRAILMVAAAAVVVAVMATTAIGAGGARDGVGGSLRVTPHVAGNVNFDNIVVPGAFAQTVKLHKLDGVKFTGGGTVLEQSGNFGVTGFSAPNFLAFNCDASTADPRAANLPETIDLRQNHTSVSLKVGSSGSAGTIVKLHAISAGGTHQNRFVGLTSSMQTVSFSIHVKTIKITSPDATNPTCVMVLDDLQYS